MIKKNNLFELIHSLSVSEKRFFRQSFGGQGNDRSNYLRLFNEIDKMDAYDESKIRKIFQGEKFINQLHVTKIYLQDSILTSLRNYYRSSSVSMLLKNHLQNIEIYFNKELYNLCALEIRKAGKSAMRFEDETTLLEILNWKRKLLQAQSPQDFDVKEVLDAQRASIERLVNVQGLWNEMINGPSGTELPEPQSLSAKVLCYHIKYRDAIQQGKNDRAKTSLLELISILQKHPHRIEEDPSIYLSTMNNLLSFLVFTGNSDETSSILPRVKSFYNRIDSIKKTKGNFRLILRTYNIELEMYRDAESLEDAVRLITEIQRLLTGHENRTPHSYMVSFWFQFAYIFFF